MAEKYGVEFISYGICTIEAENDEQAVELAMKKAVELNKTSDFIIRNIGFDYFDVHHVWRENDKTIYYN